MPLTKVPGKLIVILFLVFTTSILYIFYIKDNGTYSEKSLNNLINKSLDNVSNNSVNVSVRAGDSIQQAINITKSGDTIIVYPGLYKENLFVYKPLVIISKPDETGGVIIQAADPEKDIFNVTADNVTISGFNITGTERAGIHCSCSYSNITGNKLSYNEYGVYFNNSSSNTLENNEMINNSLGIYLKGSDNNLLKNNNVSGVGIFVGLENEARGICLEDSDNNKLIGNAISKLMDGVNLTESSSNELNNNSILDNYFSLTLINSNNNKVMNNTIVKRGYSYSVVLAHSQNNTLHGNTGGLNTEIKVTYGFNSTNNTLEGEIDNADEPRIPTIGSGDSWV